MPYALLDDRYDDHRKTKKAWRANPAAVGLHAMAITYCSRHKTDGKVDAEWVEERLMFSALKPRERRGVIDALLDAGLFERDGENYLVHDFLQWNNSRAERAALAEQGRRGGLAKAAKAAAAAEPLDGFGSSHGSSLGQSDGHGPDPSQGSGLSSSDGSSTPRLASPRLASPSKNTPSSLRSDVLEVFAYWQATCGHPTAKLTADRRAKITARLSGPPDQRYTVADIRKAIDGAARAPYVNEAGKRFDDIELICRNGSKLEDFMGRADGGNGLVVRSPRLVPLRPNAGELIEKIQAAEGEAS